MKLPFRFHRGEINGFFLLRLATFLNFAIAGIVEEIVYWANVQFKVVVEVSNSIEMPMRDADIIGIGVVAGVFPLVMTGGAWAGAVLLTESHVVGGQDRSERGLYNTVTETFEFKQVDNDTYPADISTLATPALKSTLVPAGTAVVGYVAAGTPLYDLYGAVIWANVLSTPPSGVAYDIFYGENYLTLSSDALVVAGMPIELVKALIEAMQRIRYNGPTIKSLFYVTELLCGALISDINITRSVDNTHYVMAYAIDLSIIIDNKLAVINAWKQVVKSKFKIFELSEII
jgi:hypothetical protein